MFKETKRTTEWRRPAAFSPATHSNQLGKDYRPHSERETQREEQKRPHGAGAGRVKEEKDRRGDY